MATTYPEIALAPDLRSLLAGLRWRIRLYIWLEGLALAVLWLGLMFWIGLALDYLPVLLGASEMPAAARAVLLGLTGIVTAYILYRWILRRAFVRLGDQSMALLLERRYGAFDDSLVTAVEMAAVPDHAATFNRELLARTADEARGRVQEVRYGAIFNGRSLAWTLTAAALTALSLVAFYAVNAAAFEQATERLYLLSDKPWPRSAKIEVVGIEVLRASTAGEETPRSFTVEYGDDKVIKVAKGSNVSLKVRAAQAPEAQVVPQSCTIYYRTLKDGERIRGERGSVTMSSYRDANEWRNFWFDNKPFKGVLASIDFDVVGYDDRASGYRLEVVDSPAVVETTLDLVYPKYMVDEATSSHLPAMGQPYLPAGTFIPVGTQVTLKFKTNKNLQQVEIVSSGSGETSSGGTRLIELSPGAENRQSFEYRIDALKGSVTLDVSLLDADNVATERPYRVFLTAIDDQPPQIEVNLKGIGSAVTPDVVIPLRGKISDDYAIERTWVDVQVNDSGDPQDRPFGLGKSGAASHELDFRYERAEKTGLDIKPGDKLLLAVKAADKFDLTGEPHVAVGDRYQLDVVTAEELLSQLEVREVGLRRRFELILEELTQMRDSLLRVKAGLTPGASGASDLDDLRSDDDQDKQLTPEQKAQRAAELRLLRVQRALMQSQKSVAEVLGVAAGFLDIREELINNRVDTEDRKNRLKEQIADPLNRTCSEQFPKLDERLTALEAKLREGGVKIATADAAPVADESIDQANLVLSELEAVLAKMQDLETYNELLEIVRDLLKDQEKLIERTQQERKRATLEELKKLQ